MGGGSAVDANACTPARFLPVSISAAQAPMITARGPTLNRADFIMSGAGHASTAIRFFAPIYISRLQHS
jgi:hypothetical protein